MPALVPVAALRAACLALVLALPHAGAAIAKTSLEIYECSFAKRTSNKGWVPLIVVLARAPGADSATINDPIMQHFTGGPMDVRVHEETDARVVYRWRVPVKTQTGQSAPIDYRLSSRKDGLTAKITGLPSGYDDSFSSDGTCKRTIK